MNWARFHQAAIRFHKTASARHGLWVMPLAVLLMVVMSLASCTTHDGYLHYQSLRVSGWEYRDSAAFIVDSLPTSGTRHLTIALRKSSTPVWRLPCTKPGSWATARCSIVPTRSTAPSTIPTEWCALRECRSILTNFLSALSHYLLTPQDVWSSAI